jgi:hypothetical protein
LIVLMRREKFIHKSQNSTHPSRRFGNLLRL